MSKFANSISEQVIALEQECNRHQRDSRFYKRLLVQIAMQNGGSIKIDPAFGDAAITFDGALMIDSTGFHLGSITAN